MAVRKAVESITSMEDLKRAKQWVNWIRDPERGKVPINPTTGGCAQSNNPATWSTYKQAEANVGKTIKYKKSDAKITGIGFMFACGVCGIDIDGFDSDAEREARAKDIIQLMDTYTEYSPSGKGYHLIFHCDITMLPKDYKAAFYQKNDKFGIECYFSGMTYRFFTYTCEAVNNCDLEDRTKEVLSFLDRYMKKPVPDALPSKPTQVTPAADQKTRIRGNKTDTDYLNDGLKHDKLLIAYWNGNRPGGNESADDQGFMNKLAYWCNKNVDLMHSAFLDSPYCAGKDAAHKMKCSRPDYLDRTIQAALRGTKLTAREKDEGYKLEQARKDFAQADKPDEWEQPIPFDNISVPAFPIECLPAPLRNYVLAVSEATQTPIDMAAVAGLVVMAACVQGKYKIQGKPDWIEPLNLYSVIVANPAERKSAVLALLTKYINEYEHNHNEKNAEDINRSRMEKNILIKEIEWLMGQVSKNKGDKDILLEKQDELTRFKEVKPLRLLADDVTPEALTSLLAANNGRMAAISSEGGIFEMLQGRYTQGVNIDVFLKAHCGDPIRVDRKGRESEFIKEPCLTALFSIQPQVLDGLVGNEVFRGRGLTARFMYCIPQSTIGSREFETETIPQQYKDDYREKCFDLLDLNQGAGAEVLKLSEEAHALSAQFARELEPRLIDDLECMADFAGKLHGAILRIAGVMHLINQDVFAATEPVPRETMQAAIQIGYYFLEHAKAAYQLMGADEQAQEAKYILDKLKQKKLERFTKNDLMKICRKYKHVDELREPISTLIEFNYVKELEKIQSINNRSVETYLLSPIIYQSMT